MSPGLTSRVGQRTIPLLTVLAVFLPLTARAEVLDAALSFDEVVNQVDPTTHPHGQPRVLELNVIDRSRVSDWNARRPGQPNERAQDLKGRIGTPIQIGETSMTWRLDGLKTVVRETNYPSFLETITITFHSHTCDATVEYRLKPGNRYFGMWNLNTGASLPISQLRADHIRCRLGAEAIS